MYNQTIFIVFVLSIYLLIIKTIQALKMRKKHTQSTCFLLYKPKDGWPKVKQQQENQYFPWFKLFKIKCIKSKLVIKNCFMLSIEQRPEIDICQLVKN